MNPTIDFIIPKLNPLICCNPKIFCEEWNQAVIEHKDAFFQTIDIIGGELESVHPDTPTKYFQILHLGKRFRLSFTEIGRVPRLAKLARKSRMPVIHGIADEMNEQEDIFYSDIHRAMKNKSNFMSVRDYCLNDTMFCIICDFVRASGTRIHSDG